MSSQSIPAGVRQELESERDNLRAQLEELGHGEGSALVYDSNFADTSQVTAERGETENLAQSLREALHEVDDALAKIDNGTYGNCERCGKPIASARLEAKPTARRCIDCVGLR